MGDGDVVMVGRLVSVDGDVESVAEIGVDPACDGRIYVRRHGQVWRAADRVTWWMGPFICSIEREEAPARVIDMAGFALVSSVGMAVGVLGVWKVCEIVGALL